MAVLTVCKIPVIFLVMFVLGHHRVQTFKLNNDVLSFLDNSDYSEHDSSHQDTSSYHSREDDHDDYSDFDDDDHDDDDVPSEIDLTNDSDAFSHDYESEDPDFVPSEIDLTNDSPSSSSDDHESEDPDSVPSEIDLTNNSDAFSHDYESEDPDFVPSEIDLTNDSPSSSSDDYESEDPDFVPSEIDLTNDSPSSSSDDHESEDPDFFPSEIDLTNDSDTFSHDYESEDPDFVPSEIDLTNDSPSSSSDDYESEDPDFVPVEQMSEDYISEDVPPTDDRLDLAPKRIRTSPRRHPAVFANGQEAQGLGSNPSTQLNEHAKDKTFKRPGKQLSGSPLPRRLKEIRQADTEYFDLYLCGQFIDIAADDTNRFAVMGFNYAGRSQPFLPCQDPLAARETVNYLYRTQTDDLNAFQQVVRDLPATWQRYVAEKGSAPRTVHIFTFNAPANVTDVAQFLQLRTSEPYSSARFVLGYINQRLEMENGDGAPSDLDRDFMDLLDELKEARVEAVRVCGRCLKVAGYPVAGRRRNAMRYGMSALPWPTNSQCRTDQEVNIPGAHFSEKTCNSFQKSVAKCVVRSLDRRFSRHDDASLSSKGTNKVLQRKLGDVTRLCVRDKRCWRRQSASIRDMYLPSVVVPDSHRRGGTKLDFGKILERCVSGATEQPLDIL